MKITIQGCEIIIDDGDAHLFKNEWFVTAGPVKYVRRQERIDGKKVVIFLHRAILEAPDGAIVDHVNCNPLDNRRENLRIVSASANSRNKLKMSSRPASSRFKGVSINRNAWRATIRTDGGAVYLGRFADEVEAAFMYDCASLKYHGEFGRRNFLPLV
jgi:hypothetical protein